MFSRCLKAMRAAIKAALSRNQPSPTALSGLSLPSIHNPIGNSQLRCNDGGRHYNQRISVRCGFNAWGHELFFGSFRDFTHRRGLFPFESATATPTAELVHRGQFECDRREQRDVGLSDLNFLPSGKQCR